VMPLELRILTALLWVVYSAFFVDLALSYFSQPSTLFVVAGGLILITVVLLNVLVGRKMVVPYIKTLLKGENE